MIAHPDSEIPGILRILKDLLRVNGKSYSDLARELRVSERSLKRYLTGHGLDMHLLEQLCSIAGVSFADLAILAARETDIRPRVLSEEQESALSQNLFAAFVFRLLRYGWSPQQVQQEFQIDEVELIRHLTLLDRLGLVMLLPGNRVRVLTQRTITWKPGGPMRKAFSKVAKRGFMAMNYGAAGTIWELNTLKLSETDEGRLRDLMEDFAVAVMQFAERRDRTIMQDGGEWHSILIAIRRADPKRLLESDPII